MAKKKKDITSDEISVASMIASKFGKEVTIALETLIPTYEISTGSVSLDCIIGGGIVSGITEFFGGEGSGKTSLALGLIRNAQQQEIKTYYIDQERGLTASLVNNIPGLDTKEFSKNILRPTHGQECCDIIEMIVKQSPRSIIVLDSIPAMISSAQINESASKEFYAVIPKILSNFLPKIKTLLSRQEICLVVLNQLRMKMTSYGNPNDTPGGKALKFYSSFRIKTAMHTPTKTDNLEFFDGDQKIGHILKTTVVKLKYAPPFGEAKVPLMYRAKRVAIEAIEMAIEQDIVIKNKSNHKRFRYEGSEIILDEKGNMDLLIENLKNMKVFMEVLEKVGCVDFDRMIEDGDLTEEMVSEYIESKTKS